MPDIYITKSNGVRELFNYEKLIYSLKMAGASAIVADDIAKEIGRTIKDGDTTSKIYKHAFKLLNRKDVAPSLSYSLRRSLMELGPTGFPFEKYISRIFEELGYKTLIDQIAHGRCVDHEVDIVAQKDKELVLMEAKFHNEVGIKSDLKVGLYVKARFDDLKDTVQNFGSIRGKVTKGILITNTKFTSAAVQYCKCSGVNLIGWNYPERGNLHDFINVTKLHPITALTKLSTTQKKQLLSEGIIICKDLLSNIKPLQQLSIPAPKIDEILKEISQICMS